MEYFRAIFSKLNLLSVDVVLGAMAGMLFFSDLLDVYIGPAVYLLLGIAVWVVYSIDHLLDSKKLKKGNTYLPRHQFHQKNFKRIFSAVAIFALLGLIVLLFFESSKILIVPGAVLMSVVALWFFILHLTGLRASWLKEVSTAVVYVAGICLAPFAMAEAEKLNHYFWTFAVLYFFLACLNLLILSFQDAEEDRDAGFGSILTVMSKMQLKNVIVVLGILVSLVSFLLIFIFPSYYSLHAAILALIGMYHLLEFFKKGQKKETTRAKLEASFLLPFVLLVF
ncbi:hypothetical protein [Arthrospiribacter ruber]|uniref:Prenyltransferase n=1 Tax=Arthrospiribacter ruber TaxID=2487934 RepID=A0A951IXA7_9BACT|nr:hypothetical protein [Arthrospiribacter ruber]MBW3467762.1 hypothetical protein [Arthrospiribacter ruber]